MDRALLDTSALSDIIQPASKRFPAVSGHLTAYLGQHGRLTISELSCYEILRGMRKKLAHVQEAKFVEFCRHAELMPVTYAILDRAATLWADGKRQGISVDDGDLIIAATALQHSLPLVTANPRHFAWIAGLTLSNWRTV